MISCERLVVCTLFGSTEDNTAFRTYANSINGDSKKMYPESRALIGVRK